MIPGFPMPLAMGESDPTLDLATAGYFDGTGSDYLSRNDGSYTTVGSQTTISLWFKQGSTDSGRVLFTTRQFAASGNIGYNILAYSSSLVIQARDSSQNAKLQINVPYVEADEWVHFLVSLDLSNPSNRHFFVNDADATSGVTWSTYASGNIVLREYKYVGGLADLAPITGYVGHLFVDDTYRDLTLTSTRRKFNDGNGGPADGQENLSPLIYLPISSEAPSFGTNLGTLGDFTVNGDLT